MEWVYAYAYFIIYAFLGWVCEDIYCGIGKRKFINRGFLYGPCCPIYGVGAILVIYPLLLVQYHPSLVFLFGILITSTLEYFTSWVMEKLFHTRWWDYSKHRFNINGRVCLLNSTLFGLMCMILIFFVHPHVEHFVHQFSFPVLVSFLILFTIGFGVDIVMTILTLMQRKQVFKHMRQEVELFKQEYEKDRKERLDNFTESIGLWLKERPELKENVSHLKISLEHLDKIQRKHISNAFPERQLQEDFKSLADLAKRIHAQSNEENKD